MGFLQSLHTSTWTMLAETVAVPCTLPECKDIKVLLCVTPGKLTGRVEVKQYISQTRC
jgi:hypothetical protein